MANYITASEFSTITGISWEEAGESAISSTTIRDARITEAQEEFDKEVAKSFTGTEDDYKTAQRSVAFLTGHLIYLRQMGLVQQDTGTFGSNTSVFLKEYNRLIKLLKMGETNPDKQPIWSAGFETVEV